MNWLDYVFIIVPLAFVFGVGWHVKRYMRSVADFMSGGRVAGRYLLTVARGEQSGGAVVFVAMFEIISRSGFTIAWWGWMLGPLSLIVSIMGFVIYRYRETRALTLAQFFEIRYNKSFRVFTGMLGFLAGILNFGIIPVIGARFITQLFGLPHTLQIGALTVTTPLLVMAALLTLTVYLTISGGLVSVMVTDCVEGIISQLIYLVIIIALLCLFSWPEISAVLGDRPPGQSLLNPLDSGGLQDFNLGFVIMGFLLTVYGTMAWQNQSAFNSAGLTPHENRMGGILGGWRDRGRATMVTLLAVCAMAYLYHPDFAAESQRVHELVAKIPDAQTRQQMLLPVAVTQLLPVGIKGLLCVVLLMGVFGGDSTHLHSWSSLFVQDVLVPLRKKPFAPKQHIRILRGAVIGVAVFVFLFGALFPQTDYVVMWFNVTTAIYVGGAGAVIIGGLYWKKGTTAGAWAALLTGSGLSLGGIVMQQLCGPGRFPLNGIQISFCASLLAALAYLVVSLLTCREDFNLERMLHRGIYAQGGAETDGAQTTPRAAVPKISWWGKIIGLDENFTRGDKWMAGVTFGFSVLWTLVFLAGTAWNFIAPWPLAVWSAFWHVVGIGLPVLVSAITAVWFSWGGIRDILDLFRRLRDAKVNHLDDGTVVGNRNLDEVG